MAEDNFKRNIKDEKEFLQIQKDIKEQFENQVGSIRDYAEWQKKVGQVWKELKTMQKEINRLEKEGTVEAQKKAEELKKEYNQLLAINKELVKQGGLLKATANIVDKQWGGVLSNILNKWFDFDEAVRKTAVNMGISAGRMSVMQDNIIKASMYAQSWGVSAQELAEAQGAYSDEVGRAVILTDEAYKSMARIGTQTGLGAQGVATMAAQMDQFGIGAERSVSLIAELSSGAEAMGVNSGKVLKKFEQNLGLMNKLNFKSGVKGMMQMAKFSEKYKIDMNAVAGVADKVFRPEGAIEAAAQLQVLGGDLAALGDPFTLMYKARNSPEELAKSLTKAASASATFNAKTGEFDVNANELDRLREAANALGMDYNNLVEVAKQGAKIKKFEGMLGGGFTDEEKEFLTGIADAEGKVDMGFGPDGKKQVKLLSELSSDEAKNLMEKRKLDDENQKNALSIRQEWENTMNQLAMTTWPLLKSVQDFVKPFLDQLVPMITKFFTWLSEWKKTIGTLLIAITGLWAITKITKGITAIKDTFGAIFGSSKNFKAGYEMGEGFKAATMGKQSSVSSGAKDMLKQQKGAPTGTDKLEKVSGGSDKVGSSGPNTIGSKLKDLAAGLEAMGTPKVLFGAFNLIPTAVGMLTMVAAIPTLAFLGKVGLEKLGNNLMNMAIGLEFMGNTKVLAGAAILIVAGIGFAAMTAGILGMGAIALLGEAVGFGLEGLAIGLEAFGGIAGNPMVWLGVLLLAALAGTFVIFAYGVTLVAEGIANVVNSFTQMFAVIGANGSGLLSAGVGFMAMAAGVGILTVSLIALGASALLALPGLMILGGVTSMLTQTASALASTGGGGGLESTINAINSVDTEKLNALKDLSTWMALIGASPTIKFDESLSIDGNIQISGQAGGKTNTDWINDAMFINALKEKIMKSSESERTAPGRNQ
jgi:hypothetical protein